MSDSLARQVTLRTDAQLRELRLERLKERRVRVALTSTCLIAIALGFVFDSVFLSPPSVYISLYVLAYIAGGYFSFINATKQLLRGSVNIDFLMIFAAIGAAIVNEWPEGAFLLFLFSLSGTLEEYILGRTRNAIEKLMDLTPSRATVLRGEKQVVVGVEELVLNDIVIVRPGEKISADGEIVEGATSVDQSAITGESIPVDKVKGDIVFAGTLNQQGAVHIRVNRLASESTISRIVQLVEEAGSQRAKSQRFTDWFGERYTFLVLGGSSLVGFALYHFFHFSFQDAFYRAMTVLVVASPCAVVISIPAAILSAIGAGARAGVLFKGGIHLESISKIRAIAFDKTGTLTVGKPKVIFIFPAPGKTELEVLQIAASAEFHSEHPLARAVVREAIGRGIEFTPANNLKAVVGKGIEATLGGRKVLAGKHELFESVGARVSKECLQAGADSVSHGKTTIYVGDETELYGVIGLADVLRPQAVQAVRELRALGVEKLVMLTGDNSSVAESVAKELGIEFKAELLPEDKVEEIKKIREKYGEVAMIGDGINDAPSIAVSSLGISLGGTGSAVALETADIVLMGDNLQLLPFAIELGKKAQQIIKQNLLFAFGVMFILFISTLFAQIRLPVAVLGHEGSTVLVILNGLRLLAMSIKVKTPEL